MFYIHKRILKAADEVDGTFDSSNHLNWLQFSYIEICHFFLPYCLLDVGLDAVDGSIDEEARQEGNIFIAQLLHQKLQVAERVIGNNGF